MLLIGATSEVAASDPYGPGTTGYDVSYPQCGAAQPTGAFAIVGVNGGRPFTNNSCLASEYAAAPQSSPPSLYINTGYSVAYRKNITAGCSTASTSVTGTSQQKQAWAIGCSESETSLNHAGSVSASAWWLDVETGNSWSSSNLSLNRYAIQGAVTRLLQASPNVGVYSTASMWNTISGGGFTPAGVAADWVAAGSCATPFTSSPVWLTQSTSGGVDFDTAC